MQGPVHAAATIIKEEGILGLWAGAAPTIMRNGTNQMCLFWAKNNFDGLFFGKHEGDGTTLQPWQSMVSGFTAACLGPVATGPFDVIKVCCPDVCRVSCCVHGGCNVFCLSSLARTLLACNPQRFLPAHWQAMDVWCTAVNCLVAGMCIF